MTCVDSGPRGLLVRLAPALLSVALAAPGVSCGERATPPGYITIAVVNSPNHLDPRIGTDDVSVRLHYLIFSRLLTIDDDLRVVPALATVGARRPHQAHLLVVPQRRGGDARAGCHLTDRERVGHGS